MISAEKLYHNFFSHKDITPSRLANFSHDVLSRLIANNSGENNAALIQILTPALNKLKAELGETDTALGLRKGKTLSVDQFRAHFKETIRHYEGAIAFALGGVKTPAYTEFFPKGLTEYTTAGKTSMTVLLTRLKVAAVKYAAKLDAGMVARLQELDATWQDIRNEQVQQKANLVDNRTDRKSARKEVETALLIIVHSLGVRYPGNVEECGSYFDFSLLFSQGRKSKKEEKKKAAKVA